MIIPERQILAKTRILEVRAGITKAIDAVCKKEKYQVTYAEINAALLQVLQSNVDYELRDLWREENDEENDEENHR